MNIIIKLSEINTLEMCGKKYEYDKLKITTNKGKNYYLSIAMKEVIRNLLSMNDEEFHFNFNRGYIIDYLDRKLDDSLFNVLSKKEYLIEASLQIKRYVNFLKQRKVEILVKNLVRDFEFNGKKIIVTADLVLKHESDTIEIVKIKRGKPKLSYAARKFENKPQNNIELYLLQVLGEKMYPSKRVISCYHYMVSKNDSKDVFLKNYNSEIGYNIVSFLPCEKTKELENRVNKIIEKSQGDVFDKTLETKNCNICPYNNICNYKKPQEVELEEVKRIKKAPANFDLTNTQREAIMSENGIFRINAGAGSGKTTVVALRVVELILDGCNPEDILMVTFTNKGAVEMREKISYWLKKEGITKSIKKLNIMTFNSWGDKVVKEKYKILGFTKPPQLIEKIEKYDILFDLLKNEDKLDGFNYKNPLMNFRYAKGVIVELENLFNYFDSNNVQTFKDSLVVKKIGENRKDVFNIYKKYKKTLKEKNLIEYQDQIKLITVLMEEFPEELGNYNYEHIIVDEFQDTDLTQLDVVLFLSNQPKFKSLMVVGDDAQSIFGFRNTSQEYILNFHKYFKEVKDINMVENFRSTSEIIKLANKINSFNKNKVSKELISGLKKEGEIAELDTFKSAEKEYSFISDKIKKLLSEGNKPEDIGIIARTKSELFCMEKYLKQNDIPYIIDIPEPFLNNANVYVANSFINFLENPEITQGMFEYLYVVTDGFKNMNKKDIQNEINKAKKALISLNEKIKGEKTDNIEIETDIDNEEINKKKLDIFFEKLSKIEDNVFQKFLEDLKNKNLPFIQLKRYLNKFIEYEDKKTFDKNDKRYRAVTLTTAHTSKGKEFKIVFNTISKYKAPKEGVEEERRVFFVSLTRAKDRLYITYNEKTMGVSQYSPIQDMERILKKN